MRTSMWPFSRNTKLLCLLTCFCAATAIASSAQTLTTLYSFCPQQTCADGAGPVSALVQGSDGNLYGTTYQGGDKNAGTIFKITPTGTYTRLYSFCSQAQCADGQWPLPSLVQAGDGNFYGVASSGTSGSGNVFRITPSGVFTVIYQFCSWVDCTDGAQPRGTLVVGTDGNLYGTTFQGGYGQNGPGSIFMLTLSGTLTSLHKFNGADGANPEAGLALGRDGNFYGTTISQGANNGGTIFKITPDGSLTTLYNFCALDACVDGYHPALYSPMLQAGDGNFYGTTQDGGGANMGNIYQITPTGTYTVLYSFCRQQGCPDGRTPFAGLIQGGDGNLYGTTQGDSFYPGTIYRITTSGAFTNLYTFTGGSDGSEPWGALVQTSDGNMYGTTELGGANGSGTVFRFGGAPPPQNGFQFVPLSGCRLLDTRQTNAPILGGTVQSFTIPQLGNCDIPTTAAAYSLNLTVVPHGPLGYLTIWPTGAAQPTVSTLNSDGRIKANAAIVGAGTGGAVSVYVTNTTDLLLDIDGYFTTPGQNTYQFYMLTPCRIMDTRIGLGGAYLQGQQERDIPVQTSSCMPADMDIAAYALNVTVEPQPANWGLPMNYLTVWPQGSQQPATSTLNNHNGTGIANAAIVQAGTGGGIAVFPTGNTELVLDVVGYFAAPGSGMNYYPVTPCRAHDSRNNNGQPFTGDQTVDIVDSPCAPPGTAQAYALNATIVPTGTLGYLTVWANPGDQPGVPTSTLNSYDGSIMSNMALVQDLDGSIDTYAAYGYTQLILDISGYFAPQTGELKSRPVK